MLRLEDVALTVGTRELLVGADLHIRPQQRVGLVGPNGSGKTSLLRLMVGELDPEAGKVHRRGGISLGYLPQKAVSGSSATVWDEAASQMHRIRKLETDYRAAEAAVAGGDTSAVERLGDATEALRLAGGFAVEERIGSVLHGLGFGPDTWQRTCDTFSGGWQMRIALARLLLSDPDVMLLDEPTNHLDLAARSWLARYIAGVRATVVVVSHDRHLLDHATTHTAEVRHKSLMMFSGNISAWLAERASREETAAAAYRQQQAEIARLERFVDRFKAKATKAAQARSRQKQLDRMERLDAPVSEQQVRLRLPEAPGCVTETLVLRDVTAGWDDGPDIVKNVDFVLRRGERVAVLGPNGCGKSTLLKLLSGKLAPRSGRRKLGKDVRIGVFSQDLAQALPPNLSGLEHVQTLAPTVPPQRIRAALGALGLRGDAALRPIGLLSGGEKARVVLASFAIRSFNVLLLDEPTNHLDAMSVDVLVEALSGFEGAILVVTHDRFLVERIATHIAIVQDGTVTLHEGVRPELLEPVSQGSESPVSDDRAPATGKLDHEARKQRRRERTKAQRRFERLSKDLETSETRLAELEARGMEVAQDYQKASEVEAQRAEEEARCEAIFEEMAELEEVIEALTDN